jgi:predicted Zn-ribbon and HTH transcriptional regulator
MVPIGSWLVNGKVIRKSRARWNATLGHANRAIHVVGAILEETVEVDTGALVAELQFISIVKNVLVYIHGLTWLCTLATTRSPLVKLSKGSGHWPLIPMTGRSTTPSGFALTQVMFQSSVTVAALDAVAKAERTARKHDNDQAMSPTRCERCARCEEFRPTVNTTMVFTDLVVVVAK